MEVEGGEWMVDETQDFLFSPLSLVNFAQTFKVLKLQFKLKIRKRAAKTEN